MTINTKLCLININAICLSNMNLSSRQSPKNPDDIKLDYGAFAGLNTAKSCGWTVVAYFNAHLVRKEEVTLQQQHATNHALLKQCPQIEAVLFAIASDTDFCATHRDNSGLFHLQAEEPAWLPKPGLIIWAIEEYEALPSTTKLITNYSTDQIAAKAAKVGWVLGHYWRESHMRNKLPFAVKSL